MQDVIRDYEDVIDGLKQAQNKAKTILEKHKKHSTIRPVEISKPIEDAFQKVLTETRSKRDEFAKIISHDEVFNKLELILNGFIGHKFTETELNDIYRVGNARYQKKVPPGFQDAEKQEPDRYGDLIIWMEILNYVKKQPSPILLISNDIKDDWLWEPRKGEAYGPRPELIQEIGAYGGKPFWIFEAFSFLEGAKTRLGLSIAVKSVTEAVRVQSSSRNVSYARPVSKRVRFSAEYGIDIENLEANLLNYANTSLPSSLTSISSFSSVEEISDLFVEIFEANNGENIFIKGKGDATVQFDARIDQNLTFPFEFSATLDFDLDLTEVLEFNVDTSSYFEEDDEPAEFPPEEDLPF